MIKFNKKIYDLSSKKNIAVYASRDLLKISSLTPILKDFICANLGRTLDIREFDSQNIDGSLKDNNCISVSSDQINNYIEYYPSSYINVQMSLSASSAAEEYRESNEVKGNIGAQYGPFSGSLSASYSAVKKELSSFRNQAIQGDIMANFGEFKLTDYNKNKIISEDFKYSVKSIVDIDSAKSFIKEYGTHYISSFKFGGKGSNVLVMSISDIANLQASSSGLEASIKAFFVSASVSHNSGSGSDVKKYSKDMKMQINLIGGTTLPTIRDGSVDYSAWVGTILDRPAVIDISVDMIFNLIDKDNMPDLDTDKIKDLLNKARIDMFGAPMSGQVKLSSKVTLNTSFGNKVCHMMSAVGFAEAHGAVYYYFPSNRLSYNNAEIIIIPRDKVVSMKKSNEKVEDTCKRYVNQLDTNSDFVKDSDDIYTIMVPLNGNYYNLNSGLVSTAQPFGKNCPGALIWEQGGGVLNDTIWFQIKKVVNIDSDSDILDRSNVYITTVSDVTDCNGTSFLPVGSFLCVESIDSEGMYLGFASGLGSNGVNKIWILSNHTMKPLSN